MSQETRDLLDRLNAATTAVGDRIDALIAANTNLPADVKTELAALADHLQAMGTSPNNPVPPIPPVT